MTAAVTYNRTTYFNNLSLNQSENFTLRRNSFLSLQESLDNLKNDNRPLEFASPLYNPFEPDVLKIVHTPGNPKTGGLQGANTRGRPHGGIDIKAEVGTPVKSSEDGVVVLAGNVTGFGRVVYVNHRGGIQSRYAHLNKGENGIRAQVGELVIKGQTLGESGRTGNAGGASVISHLHFEIREIKDPKTNPTSTSRFDSSALNPVGFITQPKTNGFSLETPELNIRCDYQQLLRGTYEK